MKIREEIRNLIRPDLSQFIPYENGGGDRKGMVLLNANEAPYCPLWPMRLNRYPDPRQMRLRKILAEIFDIHIERLFIGHGSDEIIDLLIRGFCVPGRDSIAVLTPTYGMYAVCASLNGVDVISIPLGEGFQPNRERVLSKGKRAKILFICSPNNPTGNLLQREIVIDLIRGFPGMVVVDEAYIDFSGDPGWMSDGLKYPNLLVLRTLSKGWGLAGVRVGALSGDPGVVSFLSSIKLPYNISTPSLEAVMKALKRQRYRERNTEMLVTRREILRAGLMNLKMVKHIYSSDANFLMVKFRNGEQVFRYLYEKRILVRDVSSLHGCRNCLRITVGGDRENKKLLKILDLYREEESDGKNFIS